MRVGRGEFKSPLRHTSGRVSPGEARFLAVYLGRDRVHFDGIVANATWFARSLSCGSHSGGGARYAWGRRQRSGQINTCR